MLDLELLGPVGDDSLEPFRRIADSPARVPAAPFT